MAGQSATAAVGSTAGAAGSVLLSLLLVLGLILGLAWLVSRLRGAGLQATSGAALRAHAQLALGLKERVVLIEAGGAWLLLGVAPGRVELLHRYESAPELPAAPIATGFETVLRQVGLMRSGA
jgi:flagellar protein FliO/FliZ